MSNEQKERNIIVIGSSGSGKSTLVNHIVGKDNFSPVRTGVNGSLKSTSEDNSDLSTSNACVCKSCKILIDEELFHSRIIEVEDVNQLKLHFYSDCNCNEINRYNIILFTVRLGRDYDSYCEILENQLSMLRTVTNTISALVITCCESMNDESRNKHVEDFKKHSLDTASKMGIGIITVGFQNLERVSEKDYYESIIIQDRRTLRDLIKNATKVCEKNDFFKTTKWYQHCNIL